MSQPNDNIAAWQRANQQEFETCKKAVPLVAEIQTAFIARMAEAVIEGHEDLVEGGYPLNEFVDTWGHRLAHMNSITMMIAQMGTPQVQVEKPI